MKSLRLGVCGLGTVASGVINVLQRNREEIAARAGCYIDVVHVASRSRKDNCDLTGIEFTTNIDELLSNPDVDVVLELIGGYELAKDIVEKALSAGKHVVTANKALIALYGNELFAKAAENNVALAYEAGIAGGIPIIKALREGLVANQIESVAGIINGTGNFILTEMKDKGREFADVLKEAQDLGYAEADPTFDVEGIDAAHKLTILASVAFGTPLAFDDAFTEGISKVAPQDVENAEELGYRIKHLGIARRRGDGYELRVHPTLIPESELIAKVDGVMNAVQVTGNAVGKTLYYGPGAGSEATASAVIADVVDVARSHVANVTPLVGSLGYSGPLNTLPVLPIEAVNSAYYLRMTADDNPGVLAEVSSIMSQCGINIESVIQKDADQQGGQVPLIMLTQEVVESAINDAISKIEALDSIVGDVSRLRVETFNA